MSDYPYPGLRPFRPEESDIFFGREEQTDQLLERLGSNHFLAVLGGSGCGKSSLVYTGMVTGLQLGLLAHAGVRWRIADFRPGVTPLNRLAERLLNPGVLGKTYGAGFASPQEAKPFLRAELARGPRALHELLDRGMVPANENLLIIVDQFEELFRFRSENPAEREEVAAFVALLLESSKHPQIYVTITMRSDFMGECAQFYGLPEAISQGLFLVPRLTREQLWDAIAAPARVFDGRVEDVLVNRLLNDAGDEPDQLPLVQHCLMWMWGLALRDGREPVVLSETDYQQVGGFAEALSRHADQAYLELSTEQQGTEQQKVAQVLFRSLTEYVGGRRDMRRPTRLDKVADLAGVSLEQVTEVVEVFRKPGRCFLTPDASIPLAADTMLDISHESLIRQWHRLKKWNEEEGEWARQYRRLEDRAQEWEKGNASLLPKLELEIASDWKKSARPTAQWAQRYGGNFDLVMKFLKKSRNKALIIKWKGNFLIILFCLVSFGSAFYFYNKSNDARTASATYKGRIILEDAFKILDEIPNKKSEGEEDAEDYEKQKIEKAENKFQEAEEKFHEAIEYRGDKVYRAYYYLGQVQFYREKSDYDKARENIEKAINRAEKIINSKSRERNKEEIEEINKCLPKAYLLLAELYLIKNGKISEEERKKNSGIARKYYQLVLDIDLATLFEKAKANIGIGKSYYGIDEEQEKSHYQLAEKADLKDPKELGEWLYLMAEAKLKTGDYPKAIELSEYIKNKKYTKDVPIALRRKQRAEALFLLGNAYSSGKNEQFNKAIEAYKEAARLNPKHRDVHLPLANALLQNGNFKEAIKKYDDLIIDPQQDKESKTYAYTGRGNAYFDLGKYQEAISDYKAALDLQPNDAKVRCHLGNVYYLQKEYDKAKTEYEKAREVSSKDGSAVKADACFGLGYICLDKGKSTGAIEFFKKAIASDPNNAQAYLALAEAYLRDNKRQEAVRNFKEATELAKNNNIRNDECFQKLREKLANDLKISETSKSSGLKKTN